MQLRREDWPFCAEVILRNHSTLAPPNGPVSYASRASRSAPRYLQPVPVVPGLNAINVEPAARHPDGLRGRWNNPVARLPVPAVMPYPVPGDPYIVRTRRRWGRLCFRFGSWLRFGKRGGQIRPRNQSPTWVGWIELAMAHSGNAWSARGHLTGSTAAEKTGRGADCEYPENPFVYSHIHLLCEDSTYAMQCKWAGHVRGEHKLTRHIHGLTGSGV
jgi:hypothetical protein